MNQGIDLRLEFRYNTGMSSTAISNQHMPRVTFHGATQTVTGSMHLVEAGGKRILLDCGIVQGYSREARNRRGVFPFAPDSIDAVILSHAHVDHCGNLPALVRQGFSGPIYCTPATRSLIALMLNDSARIQEESAQVEGLVRGSDRPGDRLIFNRQDVAQMVAQCQPLEYEQQATIADTLAVRLVEAGHILGSAMVQLNIEDHTGAYRLTFTGDLGRRGLPYLRDTGTVPECDFLICESTYGGRRHDPGEVMAEKLGTILTRTLDRGGKIFIPAFSLGRTQVVLFYLRRWMREGLIPQLPLYADSPLARHIGDVYDQHPEAFQIRPTPEDPSVHFIDTVEEGQDISHQKEPCVIVASGGMCEGGRIIGYLRQHLDDPRVSVVLVSYQAPDSLGARLLQRGPSVRFHGRNWNKWAEIVEVNGFSGHGDHDDLVSYLDPLVGQARQVALVHGELQAAETLAESLRTHGFDSVEIPARDQTLPLA